MSVRTFNPYYQLDKPFVNGLNYIIDNLPAPPPTPEAEKLFKTVIEYIGSILDSDDPTDPIPGIVGAFIAPIVPNAANAYRDNNLPNELFYNETQRMLGASILMAVKNSPPESIEELLNDSEDKVSESGLPSSEQAPLYIAIALGKASYAYWRTVIGECTPPPPDSSSSSSSSLVKWQPYIDCNRAINYANLPFWVCATMESAMLGYSQMNSFDFKIPSLGNTLGVTAGEFAALIGSLGVSAGKVIYKWVPRIRLPKLDNFVISDFIPDEYSPVRTKSKGPPRCCLIRETQVGSECKSLPACGCGGGGGGGTLA